MPDAANRFLIEDRDEGRRIDNFLMRVLKGVPRTHVYKLLRSGQVRVNGSRARPDRRLTQGDEVRVPPALTGGDATTSPRPAPISERVLEQITRAILAETDDFLVVNKPAGIAVHAGTGLSWGLIDALRALYPAPAMMELVHRLDRETSGPLVVARSNEALRALSRQFRQHTIGKYYLALVAGSWQGGRRSVESQLAVRDDNPGRKVITSDDGDPDSKVARAWFSPRQRFQKATLMEIELLTGRTHQIRVQADSLGHALAGDTRYGNPDFNRDMRALGLRRLFLHATRLEFEFNGARHVFDVPLPPELDEVIKKLPSSTRRRRG